MRRNVKISMLALVLISLAALCLPLSPDDPQNAVRTAKRILVLYSCHYNHTAQKQIAEGLEKAREIAGLEVDSFVHEFLDISPPRNAGQRSMLKEFLMRKYQGQHFDLMITVFSDALSFLMEELSGLSPDSPCLALYAREQPGLARGGKKVLQSPLYFDPRGTLELALALFPLTRSVLYVTGNSPYDKWFEEKARTDFAPWKGKLTFEYTSGMCVDRVLEHVAGLSSGTIVICARVSDDITGKTYNARDVVSQLARSSRVPVFCLATSHLDTGVVGGSLVDVENLSAMLGRRLPSLMGDAPLPLEPASRFVRPMLNWEQIKRWDVRPGLIPPGSLILNRPQTLWEQYRKILILAFCAGIILIVFVILLAVQNRRLKMAENSLRASENRYELIVKTSGQVTYEYTLSTGEIEWGSSIRRVLGYDMEEISGGFEQWLDRLHPDDKEVTVELLNKAATACAYWDVQYRLRHKRGDYVWIRDRGFFLPDETGKACCQIGMLDDITEIKKYEEELKFRNSLLSTQQEASIDGILVVDQEGSVLSYNWRFAEIWGIPPDALASGTDEPVLQTAVTRVADPEGFLRKVRELYAAPAITSHDEIQFADGRVIDRYSSPVKDPDGVYYGRIWYFRDITLRKKAEEEKIKLQEQLYQSRKLEYVGRLAGGVAHDFNNMLGVILGHLDMIMVRMRPEELIYDELMEIKKAAQRSADLTRQLLTFARRQISSPMVLDVNGTVENMIKMLRRLIGEDIDLVWTPGKDPDPVKIDPSQLDQLMVNLCVNARDAIDGVGKITIQTGTVSLDETDSGILPEGVPGDYVMIEVSDTGRGMDRETCSQIFEPFFTTKGAGEGTGLGLATVYGIVKQNGGVIHVCSELGKGSAFRIYFPVCTETRETVTKTRSEEVSHGGNETILLVEDEMAILEMITQMLEKQGYTVLSASRPDEAVQLAQGFQGTIHLLMTDVIMPGMNGRDLVANIAPLYPDIRCLFMSGYTSDIISHRGVLEDGVHFIQKPFSMKALNAKVREALESE